MPELALHPAARPLVDARGPTGPGPSRRWVTPALLLGCALTQRGARREGLALFLRWLPPGGAHAAMPAAIHLGIALRAAGLVLRNPLRAPR